MSLHQTVQDGTEAQRLLDSEIFKTAMQAMKTQIVDQWRACPVRDIEGQTLLLQLAKLADKFEGTLAGFVQGGKFAQHQIDVDSVRNETPVRKFFRKVA